MTNEGLDGDSIFSHSIVIRLIDKRVLLILRLQLALPIINVTVIIK